MYQKFSLPTTFNHNRRCQKYVDAFGVFCVIVRMEIVSRSPNIDELRMIATPDGDLS